MPYPCRCGGKLKTSKTHVEFYGIDFGIHRCEVCTKCGEEYLDSETMEKITEEVKKKGLFGLEAKTKVGIAGNSMMIRIPKKLARFIGLAKGLEVSMHPAGKKKLVVEIS